MFKTRYRIDLRDDGYLYIGYKKWHWVAWSNLGWTTDMEYAMKVIADHKNPPEPVKPITVYEE